MANDTATSPRTAKAAAPKAAAKPAAAKAAATNRQPARSRPPKHALRAPRRAPPPAPRPNTATGRGAKRATTAGTRSTTALAGDYAERAVLIPVGAALTARDRVVASVNEVVSSYSSPAKAQTQLRKFERRGSTARNRLEREVRKTRTRVERELRERRRELDRRREGVAKSLTTQVEQAQAQLEQTQSPDREGRSHPPRRRRRPRQPRPGAGSQPGLTARHELPPPGSGEDTPAAGGLPAPYLAGRSRTLSSLSQRGGTDVAPLTT